MVQMNRRTNVVLDEAGVLAKYGVPPASIPDYLALVGDAADGYPGLPGWGARSTAAVLRRFGKLEAIPADWREWRVDARNPASLARTLQSDWDRALLFRDLATLRTDIALFESVEELRWTGPSGRFAALAAKLDAAAKAGSSAARASAAPSPTLPG